MAEVRSHTFEHRGCRHSYEVHGDGDDLVVYMHGLLMDREMNRALALTLVEHGYRVVLPDFLGHGLSDKPRHASTYRMDHYATDMVALLDHLDVEQAVFGGVSLGADVSLHLAVAAPQRVRGLLFEMPVLEWAVPAAALLFTPILLAMHYVPGPAGWFGRQISRVPRTANGSLNSLLTSLSTPPEVVKAVLHGILTGPVAPTVEQRRRVDAPALVIAHTRDVIHPFSDAENLSDALPNGRLVPAHSMIELRVRPDRLTGEIIEFLDELSGDTRDEPALTG